MKTILIVDDSEINIMVFELMLKPYNINILTANNGTEAISVFGKNHVDLIMMDVCMPGISGVETSKIIKSINKDVIIVGCSAMDEFDMSIFDYFYMKPLREQDIFDIIAIL